MLTAEDVSKMTAELTPEQLQQLVYLLQKDKLTELKELARQKSKDKFVKVMRKYISKFFNELSKDSKIKKKETLNLLKQSQKTLKNVHKHIKTKNIVDANTLLRSAFENLIMGMMINESEEVYNEFINLSIDETTRKHTKPQKLRNDFRKVLRKLDGEWFADISNRDIKVMFDEFYNVMSLYTHSTILVNVIIEIENDTELDAFIIIAKQNAYFVELLLYLCLKKLCNYNGNPIDVTYILLGWYILISDVPKEKITPEKIEKIKEMLHVDLNKEYFDKNKENIDFLTTEAQKLQEDIQKNPTGFVEILEKLVK